MCRVPKLPCSTKLASIWHVVLHSVSLKPSTVMFFVAFSNAREAFDTYDH
jgi:hypothetical protein